LPNWITITLAAALIAGFQMEQSGRNAYFIISKRSLEKLCPYAAETGRVSWTKGT
jgi:hypothetical protein